MDFSKVLSTSQAKSVETVAKELDEQDVARVRRALLSEVAAKRAVVISGPAGVGYRRRVGADEAARDLIV